MKFVNYCPLLFQNTPRDERVNYEGSVKILIEKINNYLCYINYDGKYSLHDFQCVT